MGFISFYVTTNGKQTANDDAATLGKLAKVLLNYLRDWKLIQ